MGKQPDAERWHSRPALAAVTRLVLFGVPLIVAFLVVRALHRLVLGDLHPWLQLAVSAVVGITVALLTERVTRRFLPLPALLKMSMLFPGRAPSRLLVTRRASSGAELHRMLEKRDPDPQEAATAMIALIGALAAHDKRSRGHSERVRLFTDMVAAELSLTRGERDRLCWAALLHDVGKLEIATSVLNKPGALNATEWEQMRRHPADGAQLCAPLLAWLGAPGQGILEHHERYDGSGYPQGLSGDRISLAGRVISVVDAYETMTAARPYKKPMTTLAAREELAKCASTHFDPAIVKAFLAVSVPRMMWATGPLSLLTHLPYMSQLQLVGTQVASASVNSAAQVAGVTALAVGTAITPLTAATAAPPATSSHHAPRDHTESIPSPSGSPRVQVPKAAPAAEVARTNPRKAKPVPPDTTTKTHPTKPPPMDPKPAAKPKRKAKPAAKPKPNTKPTAKPKPNPKPKAKAKANTNPKPKPNTQAKAKPKAKTGTSRLAG